MREILDFPGTHKRDAIGTEQKAKWVEDVETPKTVVFDKKDS